MAHQIVNLHQKRKSKGIAKRIRKVNHQTDVKDVEQFMQRGKAQLLEKNLSKIQVLKRYCISVSFK